MKLLPLMFLLCLGAACGKKSPTKSSVNRFFVQGDPSALISGTQRDTVSFITTSNIDDFKDYATAGLSLFAEKKDMPVESKTIEEGNEAEKGNLAETEKQNFNLRAVTADEYLFEENSGKIGLGFKLVGSTLNLVSLKLGDTQIPVTPEHYSISKDKSKMSFLGSIQTGDNGKILFSMSFYKESPQNLVKIGTNTSDYYLYGPGVLVPWKLKEDRKVSVKICPTVTKKYASSYVTYAIKAWEEPFKYKTKKLNIDAREATSCKPFSDVNEHSVQYVGSYLKRAPDKKGSYNPASALVQSDLTIGNIFDADIFIWGAEIAKDKNFNDLDLIFTMTHEFGHFLGLDHQFDGTASIMSYKNVQGLTEYDSEAITKLYEE